MILLPIFLLLLTLVIILAISTLITAFVVIHWVLPYAQTHGKVWVQHKLESFLKQFYAYVQFWGFLESSKMSQLQKNDVSQYDVVKKSKSSVDEKQGQYDVVKKNAQADEKQVNPEAEGIPPTPQLIAATSEEIAHMSAQQQDEQVIALLHLLEQQKVKKKYGIVTHETWRGSFYVGSGALAGALFGGPIGAVAGILGGGALGWWRSSHYQEVEKLVKALPPAKRQTLLLEVSKIIGKKATVMGIEEIKPFQSRLWYVVRKMGTKDIKKYLDGIDNFLADTKAQCATTKYDKPAEVESIRRELRNDKSGMAIAAPIQKLAK